MFEVRHVSPRVGSEVRIDRGALLEGAHAREIESLLVERSALLFRELFPSDQEQLEFARTLGEVVPHGEEGAARRGTAVVRSKAILQPGFKWSTPW